MAYDGRVLRLALERFEADKADRGLAFRRRQAEVYRRQPRLEAIQRRLGGTMSRVIASALRKGTDPRAAVQSLREENLALQRERAALLAGMGLPEDYLEEKPACPLCGDTGYRGEAMCRCLRRYYAREQQKELSRMLDLGNQSFDTFSLEWYAPRPDPQLGVSPRENMERNRDVCVDYAYEFNGKSGNLLLTGEPGLGKTFLSACIARVVAEKGFSVVYDTAGQVFRRFEAQKFDRREDGEAEDDVDRVLRCDLLILDDLGTEMTTAFVQSALYDIVNTRLAEGRSTVVSTNLSLKDLERRYLRQTASRLAGEYRVLIFFGEDIRKLRAKQGN